jgi:glycosyl transferase family 25
MEAFFDRLNSYYDSIYVVSVAAAEARRALFAERFKGLDYHFFFGADKSLFTIAEAEAKGVYNEKLARHHHRFGKDMKHGEIACSWSHKMIYEEMLSKNYERVLIMEDDAVPDPSAIQNIPAILEEVPEDHELLFWGWDKNGSSSGRFVKKWIYHIQHSMGRLKWNHKMIKNLYARPYSAHLKIAGFHDYTYAYGLTRSGAEKLTAMQTPVQYIADNLLAHAATNEIVKGYIVWPRVFLHDSLPDGKTRESYIR